MRTLLVLLVLAAAPLPARAGAALRLTVFERGGREPSAALDLPALSLRRAPLLALDEGGGARARRGRPDVEPAIALILGIIPGFGLGHLVAGSPQWPIWLVADLVIAVVFWGPFAWDGDHRGRWGLLNLLVVVERVFEGLDAYRQAGGPNVFRAAGGPLHPAASARPQGERTAARAGGLAGWRF